MQFIAGGFACVYNMNAWTPRGLFITLGWGQVGLKREIANIVIYCYFISLYTILWCISFGILWSQGECEELERQVDARCDALIRSIERRRQWLIDAVRQDKETKQRSLKEHVASCTCKLQHTTSLLQFCIEALKENDPVSFLQVSSRAKIILIFFLLQMYSHGIRQLIRCVFKGNIYPNY